MFEKILLPIDMAHMERASAALTQAKELAQAKGCQMILMNVVVEVPPYMALELPLDINDKAQVAAKARLQELAKEHDLPENTRCEVLLGSPSNEILRMADQEPCDLIVISSHQPEFADYLLGSVAGKVVRHARCTVMVMR